MSERTVQAITCYGGSGMSDGIYNIIFHVAEALELPVVILALLALAAVLVETGMFIVELVKRRRRTFAALARSGASAREAVDAGRTTEASALLQTVAWSSAVGAAFSVIVKEVGKPGADTRIAKELADFDFSRQGRLARTRLLVRIGPALGLMGTLDPADPGARRPRPRRRRRPDRQPAARVLDHGARHPGRRDRPRTVARTRAAVRPGLLRPRVHRGDPHR